MADERKRPSLVVITGIVVLGLVVVAVGTSAALFFRYVKTDPTDSSAATRAFEVARARFNGQLPLIEYRGLCRPRLSIGLRRRHDISWAPSTRSFTVRRRATSVVQTFRSRLFE